MADSMRGSVKPRRAILSALRSWSMEAHEALAFSTQLAYFRSHFYQGPKNVFYNYKFDARNS
jgi:hypothetical protein